MFRIDKGSNTLQRIDDVSFKDLGFGERKHLQEWIAREPNALGEELLIIQKEFSGFSDTKERLDLLALDKQGFLVIIENKLDSSGRDVTWQALKYASYCAAFSKEDIRDIFQKYLNNQKNQKSAEDELISFFSPKVYDKMSLNIGFSQRIILVAAKFRKEVTSTALWLISSGLHLQCFQATPFAIDDAVFLNIKQIIPAKDIDEYTIRLANKGKYEIEAIEKEPNFNPTRRKFWVEVINAINASESNLYQNISPSDKTWISATSGVNGLKLGLTATRNYARAAFDIDTSNRVKNKQIFEQLELQKGEIERDFGESLTWESLDKNRGCRIKCEQRGDIFDEEQWPKMIAFMVNAMVRMENVFKPRLQSLSNKLG